mmetsp:Transcript_32636/g.52066  ORF Transcript_32636/g.52066 Transcript_32636/m.52066 type:complete len:111 (+) Transcript_32636:1185-1517(+)
MPAAFTRVFTQATSRNNAGKAAINSPRLARDARFLTCPWNRNNEKRNSTSLKRNRHSETRLDILLFYDISKLDRAQASSAHGTCLLAARGQAPKRLNCKQDLTFLTDLCT